MAANISPETDPGSNQDADEGRKPGTSLMSRMEINDNKAGMEGLDKEKVNQIIYEASKGSKFYDNERKKEEQLDVKIQKLKSYASKISSQSLHEGKVQADLLFEKLKLERDLSHTIVHVDMDAFYAAVEMKDDPSLRSKPMAVGGMGMLSTSNYLARKFGVRAGMPGFIGLKLCPGLVIVKPNFDRYTAVSRDIRKVLALYDPNYCPMSLDEAYLDFGKHLENRRSSLITERTFILRNSSGLSSNNESNGSIDECRCDLNSVLLPIILNSDVFLSLVGDEKEFQSYVDNFDPDSHAGNERIPTVCPVCNNKVLPSYRLKVYGLSIEDAVLEMRNRIEQSTHLTASAGIAPNMMIAKICSDKNKPNGQYRIMPDIAEIASFIEDLPIRKVSGIGKVTEKLLGGLDVVKCSDIYSKRSLLYHLFSPTSFHHFFAISLGIGSTIVERDDERKSISTEETFNEISDVAELCGKCEEMCGAVSSDMKQDNIKGKTVTLKLKTISFEVRTRSHTLPDLTNDPGVIFNAAKKLLLVEVKNSQHAPLRLRLMGVRMSKLTSATSEQVTVNSMFNKYKDREATSTKGQTQRNGNDFTNICESEVDSFVHEGEEEDGDEDFSRPITEISYPSPTQTKTKTDPLSPSKSSKETQKNGSLSSGNILSFFTRQKEMQGGQNTQRRQVTPGTSDSESEKTLQLQPVKKNIFSKPTKSFKDSSDERSRKEKDRIFILNDDDDNVTAAVPPSSHAHPSNSPPPPPVDNSSSCPICALRMSGWNLLAINNHVDSCLNRQTIRNILQDEKTESLGQSSKIKRSRPEDRNQERRHPGKVRKVQSSVLSYFQP